MVTAGIFAQVKKTVIEETPRRISFDNAAINNTVKDGSIRFPFTRTVKRSLHFNPFITISILYHLALLVVFVVFNMCNLIIS